MPTAQSDQVAVQIQGFVRRAIHVRSRRAELRSHRVVTSGAVLFDALVGELVTGVDRRNPTDGEQQDQGVAEMFGPLKLACDPGDVVVAHEGQRREGVQESVVALHRPVQLVEITVVEAAPDSLPQLILGDRINT